MQPFRDLIKPNQNFFCDDTLEKIFESSKQIVIQLVKDGVQSFDVSRQTCLQTDWSKEGLGYLLLQKHCTCNEKFPICCNVGWKLIFAGSRFTKPAERNYSPTEGEALAVSYALHHSRLFTLGCPDLFVATDHKPLLGIYNNKDLDSIDNPRILSQKESTLLWNFGIVHVEGKWTRGADALSRSPVSSSLSVSREEPDKNDNSFCLVSEHHSEVLAASEMGCITFDHVCNAVGSDQDQYQISVQYQDLLKVIKTGFPLKRDQTEPSHQ